VSTINNIYVMHVVISLPQWQ